MEYIKEKIVHYWSKRVENFSNLRIQELEGEKHLLWLSELKRYLPDRTGLKILDIGTGTGFLAFLLAAEGHHLTGIDLTEDMIQEAKRLSRVLELPAQFYVMDGENPDFPGGSFDAVITRNLTWSLPHLAQAYAQWRKLLKPQGVLINFDADYCREQPPENLPKDHAHKDLSSSMLQEYESIKDIIRPTQKPRPLWDRELLEKAGYQNISVDTGVWKRIYGQADQFYNPTPIFTITATA